MEYVPGGSLKQLLNYFHAFKEKLVRLYMCQIVSGLYELHDHGICHRDLKCSNILVDDLGTIKLSDFGFFKQIYCTSEDWKNENREYVGSERYTAPEVAANCENITTASDIWQLGCAAIEMLTGGMPWDDYNEDHLEKLIERLKQAYEMRHNPSRGRPPLPDNISKICYDFLMQCLEVDPEKRPTAK